MPETCDKCGNDRFRQEGDDFVCKNCGHRHSGTKKSGKTKQK